MTTLVFAVLVTFVLAAVLFAQGKGQRPPVPLVSPLTAYTRTQIDTGGFLLWQPFGVWTEPVFPGGEDGALVTCRLKPVGFAHCTFSTDDQSFLVNLWYSEQRQGNFERFHRITQEPGEDSSVVNGPIHFQPIGRFVDVDAFIGSVQTNYGANLDDAAAFAPWSLREWVGFTHPDDVTS